MVLLRSTAAGETRTIHPALLVLTVLLDPTENERENPAHFLPVHTLAFLRSRLDPQIREAQWISPTTDVTFLSTASERFTNIKLILFMRL